MPYTTAEHRIPGGDAGTRATLRAMQAEVNRSLCRPLVLGTAVSIVRENGLSGRDTVGIYHALREWLAGCVDFLPDPLVDGDVLRTPEYVLEEVARHGVARIDCDDCAMLAAALSKAVGIPARFRVLGFPAWAHVYTEMLTAEGWAELDVTETDDRRAEARARNPRTMTWAV